MNFWKRVFGRTPQKPVVTTPWKRHPSTSVSPELSKMLMVMVSEADCVGQDEAIKQLEKRGADVAITNISNSYLRFNSLKMFIRVDEINKKDKAEIFQRIIYVEKNARYRNKAAKRSPMVIAVESLEEAARALDALSFF